MMYAATGPEVRDLQVLLRDAGVYHGDLDGYYGNATRTGVALFQERFVTWLGDGHWDQRTIDAANALLDEQSRVDSAALCGSKPS